MQFGTSIRDQVVHVQQYKQGPIRSETFRILLVGLVITTFTDILSVYRDLAGEFLLAKFYN